MKSKYKYVYKESKFSIWDNKIDLWYSNLITTNICFFVALFPFMFLGDLLLSPLRLVDVFIRFVGRKKL